MESFGSVVMVTQFLSAYQSLIFPDAANVITTNALLKALASGEEGFDALSDVLIAILQVGSAYSYSSVFISFFLSFLLCLSFSFLTF